MTLLLRKSRMRRRARTDLCGGRSVMVVPTATVEPTWACVAGLLPYRRQIRSWRVSQTSPIPSARGFPPVDNPLVQFLSQERRKLGVLESRQRAQARSFRSLDRFGLGSAYFRAKRRPSRRHESHGEKPPTLSLCNLANCRVGRRRGGCAGQCAVACIGRRSSPRDFRRALGVARK